MLTEVYDGEDDFFDFWLHDGELRWSPFCRRLVRGASFQFRSFPILDALPQRCTRNLREITLHFACGSESSAGATAWVGAPAVAIFPPTVRTSLAPHAPCLIRHRGNGRQAHGELWGGCPYQLRQWAL